MSKTPTSSKSKKPGIRITLRDVEIVQAVYAYRALTTPHISVLLFGSPVPSSRCLLRLRLLYEHGYLHRVERPRVLPEGRKPYVYFLGAGGATLLCNEVGIDPRDLDWKASDNKVGESFIEHLLATNDVRVAMAVGAAAHSGSIETWIDDKSLRSQQLKEYVTIRDESGREHRAAVVPDGFCVFKEMHDGGEWRYRFFFEIDLATVVAESNVWGRRDWARKIEVYQEYWRSGLYQRRYQAKGFRVLSVTTTQRRLETLKAATESRGGKSRFWFTTFDQVTPDTVFTEPIWQVAGSSDQYSLLWDSLSAR